ncbi:MAG: HU family DNA-binding protein [Acidobacteria bacterium]|nr:MAG: HU family DNA-binding protein [Acidobacteriota bacterium]
MNKSELVAYVAKNAGLTKAAAEKAVDAFTDAVTRSLKKGDKVALVGFGTFSVAKRKARKGRNPATGEPMRIPATKVPRFTAGKKLKDAVRGRRK